MIRNMNKLVYLAKFFVYALSNPKKGTEMFKTKYQSIQDSASDLYDYSSKQQNLEEAIGALFPKIGRAHV